MLEFLSQNFAELLMTLGSVSSLVCCAILMDESPENPRWPEGPWARNLIVSLCILVAGAVLSWL